MIIILSVIVGYVLGISPFLAPKLINLISFSKKQSNDNNDFEEILDEYLNGRKEDFEEKKVNNENISNENILEEYLTGIPRGDDK